MEHARQASWIVGASALAVLLVAPSVPVRAATPSHDDEITTYATALAVAQVASQRCADILAYADGLTALHEYLHLVPADDMSLQIETRGMIRRFEDQAKQATSVAAWCEGAYRAFGPEGTAMRGLLAR